MTEATQPAAKKATTSSARVTNPGIAAASGTSLARFSMGRRAWARLVLLLLFLAASVAAFLQAPRPWQEVFKPASLLDELRYPIERNPHLRLPSVPVNLNAVTFLKDGRTGWLAGDAGYIAKTTDAGITWERQKIGEAPARRVDAGGWSGPIGEAHAIEAPVQQAAPAQQTLREAKVTATKYPPRAKAVSKSVAKPKQDIPPIAPPDPRRADLHSIAFADAQHGVAVGSGGTILRTEDGGKTWTATTSGTRARLYSAHLADAQRGVAVGGKTILRTEDGGKTWAAAASGTLAPLTSVHLADAQHGVAVGFGGAIQRSEDGGKTWMAAISGPSAFLYSVHLADAQYGVAVGFGGTLLRTADGGKTWNATVSGTRAWLYSVHLANARYGMVVGSDGTILRSEDGGKTWSAASSGTQAALASVHLADARHGVAVGKEGTILRTEDGGKSWIPVTRGAYPNFANKAKATGEATYSRLPAPWYWLVSLTLLGLLWPAGRLREPEIRVEAPPRTVADEYVSDRPARSAAEDRLDFLPRVDGLSRYLRNIHTEPPLTIAVNGAWGSGKSSFMRMLQADLERYGGRSVWFNAWHHQKEEHIQAALLEAVSRQAVPPWFAPGSLAFRLRLFWQRAHAAPVLALLGVALLVGIAAYYSSASQRAGQTHGERLWQTVGCLVDPPATASDAAKLSSAIEQLSRAVDRHAAQPGGAAPAEPAAPAQARRAVECEALLGLAPKTGWLEATWHLLTRGEVGTALLLMLLGLWPLTKGLLALRAFGVDPAMLKATLAGLSSRRALSQQTSFRQRFAREFGSVSEALRPAVLSVFIDDLDRCNEQQVMEVLEAVNYLVEAGRCYVVLGMVEETVQRLVGLAFEKVAAELAEQRAEQDGDPAHSEERKRAQRKRFAEHYLEKLINLKVEVPSLDAGHAAGLVAPAEDKVAAKAEQIELPRWVGWVDRALVWPCRAWLPLAILAVALASTWLARELAGNGQPTAPAAQAAAQPQAKGGVAPEPNPPAVAPDESRQRAIVLPDRLAPAPAHPGWSTGAGVAGIGLALLAALFLALASRPEYHTQDSPVFEQAFRIWTPLLLAGLKTPRGMKRFQNRVRFLAMALDAQANPEPRLPEASGPLGRWLAGREAARREAHSRYNELLPEPVLIGLSALHSLEPALLESPESLQWEGMLEGHEKAQPWAHAIDPVLAQYRQAVGNGTWPAECAWPPAPDMVERFKTVVGLAAAPGVSAEASAA